MKKFLDERNAAYDLLAKRFLARKSILAHILKHTVSEFADSSLQDIERKYIEGDPVLLLTLSLLMILSTLKANLQSRTVRLKGLSLSILFSMPLLPKAVRPLKSSLTSKRKRQRKKIITN